MQDVFRERATRDLFKPPQNRHIRKPPVATRGKPVPFMRVVCIQLCNMNPVLILSRRTRMDDSTYCNGQLIIIDISSIHKKHDYSVPPRGPSDFTHQRVAPLGTSASWEAAPLISCTLHATFNLGGGASRPP